MKVINHSLSAAISLPCLLNVIKKLEPWSVSGQIFQYNLKTASVDFDERS